MDLQNRLQEKILHNTYEQIILLLLRLAKNHGREVSDTHTVIDTQFTNREMANMIGSSRETVSRTLTQLKKKDFIQTDKTGLLQINTEALEDELF